MRTFRKILVGIGLAGVLSLGLVWGGRAPTIQHMVSAELIQKPGHVVLADAPPVFIQKPGH
jgi:hypothetical protein